MNAEEILRKLQFKGQVEATIINAPSEIENAFREAGLKVYDKMEGFKFILLFVSNKAEFDKYINPTIKKLGTDCIFWIAYPKGSTKAKTDLSRDILWKLAEPYGYRPVSQIAVDKTWSAMRFKTMVSMKKSM